LKNASAKLALEIAEKVLVSELSDKSAQEKLVSDLISKASLN
jgi:F-type H+-transporting ATPase subunit b